MIPREQEDKEDPVILMPHEYVTEIRHYGMIILNCADVNSSYKKAMHYIILD